MDDTHAVVAEPPAEESPAPRRVLVVRANASLPAALGGLEKTATVLDVTGWNEARFAELRTAVEDIVLLWAEDGPEQDLEPLRALQALGPSLPIVARVPAKRPDLEASLLVAGAKGFAMFRIATGTPKVDAASQTGRTINTKGWTASQADTRCSR